jgi:cytochrome oxidase Cu insertion factor (SCO1/SenC/PrrC family)
MMGRGFGRIFWGLLALVLVVFLGRGLWSTYLAKQNRDLPTYYELPEFSLVERAGELVNRQSLRGKVWVADFFYTHCEDTCPLQTAEMARLQKEFAGEKDLRLVSFTIDPEQDTPKVIAEYANRFGADSKRWLFLTGQREEVHRLIRNGFRLSVAIREEDHGPASHHKKWTGGRIARPSAARPLGLRDNPRGSGHPFRAVLRWFGPSDAWAHHPEKVDPRHTHSSRFVLVDRKARIRGYYHSNDKESLGLLRRDLRVLLVR